MSNATPRVVIADDSALMRRIVANSLERAGVKVVGSAKDGDEALALCERERPDAMTLDLAMPGLDGLGVLRALRVRGGRTLPVVVVSAFSAAQGARAVDALAEGAFDLVPKPAVGDGLDGFAKSLVEKVRLAAAARRTGAPPVNGARRTTRSLAPGAPACRGWCVIATSTGGPRALASLMPKLTLAVGQRDADRPAHAARASQARWRRGLTAARACMCAKRPAARRSKLTRRCWRPVDGICGSPPTGVRC